MGHNRIGVVGAALAALLVVAACNTTAQQEVKRVAASTDTVPIKYGTEQQSMALVGLVSGISRGEPIFGFPANSPTSGSLCNYKALGDTTVTYSGGRQFLGDWSTELGVVFHEELSRLGYDVAGNPKEVFHQAKSAQSSRYHVAGRLTDIKGNFCMEHHWWDGRRLDTTSGEMSVDVEWSVLDSLTDKVVFSTSTTGYFKQDKAIKQGIALTFENAFAAAATNFGADNGLRRIILRKSGPGTVDVAAKSTGLVIADGRAVDTGDAADLTRAVVTVRVGSGHGTGFFVGDEGLILTNAHVVGDARDVQIITGQGIEVTAEVIERHDVRDIAVLRSPLRIQNPPKLHLGEVEVTGTVYSVGTPVSQGFDATITRGIVSALRKERRTGLSFIQADVAVSPGNSGGPLFDQHGRIVGIAVLKVVKDGAEGLSFFIPLADGLEKLGIQVN